VKAAALLARGHIELDPFVAVVDSRLCTGGMDCDSVCVQECKSLHAIRLVEREVGGRKVKVAEVNTALCKGCGMCGAVCPFAAIHVAGWKVNQFDAMVDAIVADIA
jgi:heterodisulfide reductase subunit A